jgi:hypothetical protein
LLPKIDIYARLEERNIGPVCLADSLVIALIPWNDDNVKTLRKAFYLLLQV